MKRRDVLCNIMGLTGFVALGSAASAQTRSGLALSPAAVEELMRAHGLEPMPGEPIQVRALLLSTRLSNIPDPRIEPAIRLDPELD